MGAKPARGSGCALAQVGVASLLFSLTVVSALALLFYQLTASTKWGREDFWDQPAEALTVNSETLKHLSRGYFVRGKSTIVIVWWW